MRQVLQSREASEQEASASQPPRNRLLASALADALQERRHLADRSPESLRKLASRHNVDAEVLERLARVVRVTGSVQVDGG